MNDQIKGQLSGHYRLTATKPDGSVRLLADWFDNLITDAGLNHMGIGGSLIYVQVGSGSTAPATTDVTLAEFVAGTSNRPTNVTGNSPSAPWYGFTRVGYRFAAGAATGNISEVGVGWAQSGSLFSRALILDSEGEPTTITVLSDEVLDVSYELRMYAPVGDTEFSVTIGGVEYQCKARAADVSGGGWQPVYIVDYGAQSYPGGWGVTFYNGAIGTETQTPSGTAAHGASAAVVPYVNNSKQIQINYSASLTSGNLAGGIKSMLLVNAYMFGYTQIEFDPPIPKDATKVLSFSAVWSWDRKAA